MSLIAGGSSACIALLYVLALWRANAEVRALVPLECEPLSCPLTVIIPARNEGRRIGATLDALLQEPSGDLRVFVWDDGSDDDTSAQVRRRIDKDARLVLLESDGEDLPAGVFGKPNALAKASKRVREREEMSEFVLFLDADVWVQAGALGGLVAVLKREKAIAVSGTPSLILGSKAEQMWVPAFVSLVGQRHQPRRIHDDNAPQEAFLNGQCILVREEALTRVGGFAAVRSTVLEDKALASLLKKGGGRLRLADLRGKISTRMYTSAKEIAEGFGKNARAVLGGRLALIRLATLGVVLSWTPWVALVVVTVSLLQAGPISGGEPRAVALLVVTTSLAIVIACGATIRRTIGGQMWPALVLPLVWIFVAGVLVRAALSDAVTWKGRDYRVDDG